jgi:hypothetical protein
VASPRRSSLILKSGGSAVYGGYTWLAAPWRRMAISGGNSTRSQGVRFWTAPRTIRLVAHGLDDHAAGHWRAINLGVMGSVTVTSGTSDVQVGAVRSPDLLVSQADSASSILVTRSECEGPGQGANPGAGP